MKLPECFLTTGPKGSKETYRGLFEQFYYHVAAEGGDGWGDWCCKFSNYLEVAEWFEQWLIEVGRTGYEKIHFEDKKVISISFGEESWRFFQYEKTYELPTKYSDMLIMI